MYTRQREKPWREGTAGKTCQGEEAPSPRYIIDLCVLPPCQVASLGQATAAYGEKKGFPLQLSSYHSTIRWA
uniref:Uncharacterized protein n=1 Tax=Molossus molossus TaxID=27622 RepID=A0A7J8DBW0_MOLMO|nr:hypothetical protein HJG59_009328 [Molossus molossus]